MKLFYALLVAAFVLLIPSAHASSSTVQLNGKTFDISYDATGLNVDAIEADTSSATVTVSLTTTGASGTLQITLDRNFFDSRTNNADDEFLVVADGAETQFTEEKTDAARTLTITVPGGTNSIDIISRGEMSFGSGEQKQPKISESPITPEETTPLPTTPEPTETLTNNTSTQEPEIQCGEGTILKDGACVVETPVTMTPAEPEPPVAEPAPTTSQTSEQNQDTTKQCGPGTTLKEGLCVLDQSCGSGTILKDGQCVVDQSASTMPEGQGQQFLFGIIAAFVIALVIMIVLWGIGKAGKSKN